MQNNMDPKIKRCGWCGTPIDDNCSPLPIDVCNKLTKEQLDNAELDNGYCCPPEQEEQRMRVTRDMAMDAGDMNLEGHYI